MTSSRAAGSATARHFATIVTTSHLGYARTLLASLLRHSADCVLHCLVVDSAADTRGEQRSSSLRCYGLEDLPASDVTTRIVEKYAATNPDALRWSLKPVFVRFLLERTGEAVGFVDPDQFFVADAAPLFAFPEGGVFRLSPHWRPIDPAAGEPFSTQLTSGLYNGGLFVARAGAEAVLDWWAAACSWRCEKALERGLFDDQKYLDVVPIFFEGVDLIRHKGVNVASWNRYHLRRERAADSVIVDGDPLVCVHFAGSTIRDIRGGLDPVLEPVLAAYEEELGRHGIRLPSPAPTKSKRLGPLVERVVGEEGANHLRRFARHAKRSLHELSERLQR